MENDTTTTTQPTDRRVPVTMTISQAVLDKIDAAAAGDLRSRSNYIEAAFTAMFTEPEASTTNTSEQ